MTMHECRSFEHGEATIKTHFAADGTVERYEITQIDDAPGNTLIVTPEVIKYGAQKINDALAAIQRVRKLHWEFRDTHGNDCCWECSKPRSDETRWMRPFPCPTIAAIEDKQP